jgi:hypothetical protein
MADPDFIPVHAASDPDFIPVSGALPSAESPLAPPAVAKPTVPMHAVYLGSFGVPTDRDGSVNVPDKMDNPIAAIAKNAFQVSAPGIATSILQKVAPSVAAKIPSIATENATPVNRLPGQLIENFALSAVPEGKAESGAARTAEAEAAPRPAVIPKAKTTPSTLLNRAGEVAVRRVSSIPGVQTVKDLDYILRGDKPAEAAAPSAKPAPAPIPETNGIQWGTGGKGPIDLRGKIIPQASAAPIAGTGSAGGLAESVVEPNPSLLTKSGRIKPAVARGLQNQIERGLGNEQPAATQPIAQAAAATAPELPADFTATPKSSALRGYKYDPAAREFEYVTTDGQHYVRGDVAPEAAAQFEKTAAEKDSFGKAWHELRNNPQGGVGQFKVLNGKRVPVIKTGPVTDLAAQIKDSAEPSQAPVGKTLGDVPKAIKQSLKASAPKASAIPKAAPVGDLTDVLTRSRDQALAAKGKIAKSSPTPDYQSLIDAAMKEGSAWTPEKATPVVSELNKIPGNQFEVRGSVGEGRATDNDLDLWQKSGSLKDARSTLERLGFKYNGKTPHGETYTNGAQHVDLWDTAHEPRKGYANK